MRQNWKWLAIWAIYTLVYFLALGAITLTLVSQGEVWPVSQKVSVLALGLIAAKALDLGYDAWSKS